MSMSEPVDLLKRGNRNLPAIVDRSLAWLRESSPELCWDPLTEEPTYADGAGAANETILVDLPVTMGDGAVVDGLVIRIADPQDAAYLDANLQTQADVMTALRAQAKVPVPQVLAVDPSGEVLGVPAMIMERLSGQVPSDFPGYNRSGFVHDLPTSARRQLWTSAMDAMLAIHQTPVDVLDQVRGIPRSLDDLVSYWSSSLGWVETRRRQDAPALRDALLWLRSEQPAHDPGLSWGDARMGNMIFQGVRCVGVLDWEMCSLGGSIGDLAWWLTFDENHSTDLGLARLHGLARREETISYWREVTGQSTEALAWHEVFSLFRLSVIRMSIYEHRASLGHPTPGPNDPRSVERLQHRIASRIRPGAS
jgi:aminoglycoside phosphotransferase (APT) family kinase protein